MKKGLRKRILIQLSIFISILIIDLYVFRGYFSSSVIISPNEWNYEIDRSSKLSITKNNNKYLFNYNNNSLSPKYVLNYRSGKKLMKFNDTIFFYSLRKNLFPNYDTDYSNSFDCGTGLDLISINPFDSYKIEKTYQEIINECSYSDYFKKTEYFQKKFPKQFKHLKYHQIDSLIIKEKDFISNKDSVKVEYFIVMYSYLSKDRLRTVSNKINVSLKDLFESYIERTDKY
ncbi:hypothetical protein [Aureivirga marina]|uniref:hypothetical protein n=1 Tax=Aureivirga marina TaxID=1182451 RepID=UPI0018CB4000|nr:hypothetical protein [Aureivirga marina]